MQLSNNNNHLIIYQEDCKINYKQHHDKVATIVHWKKYHLSASKKWWDHKIEKATENVEAKVL